MNNGKICISVCAGNADEFAVQVGQAALLADLVEIRLDCLNKSEFDGEDLQSSLSNIYSSANGTPLITTFRPKEQGGNRIIDQKERDNFWRAGCDTAVADIEEDIDADIVAGSLHERICSHHDFSGVPDNIQEIFDRLAATGAEIIKIAVRANDAVDGISVWQLFENARMAEKKLIPIAMGEAGKWTRILGLAHGAYLTYAALESGNETAPGQITAHEMLDVFRVKELDEQTEVYGIIAGDTTYTMSPYVHNAAFKATGKNAVFVPFQVSDLDAFIRRMVRAETREIDVNFRGFSVTNPHKQEIIKHLDVVYETAKKTGAANTVAIVDGKLHGHNTDADGFLDSIKAKWGWDFENVRVAVVGAGGAARACVFVLKAMDADVTVIARELTKAKQMADQFDVNVAAMSEDLSFDFSSFDIVVNSTPLGTRGEHVERTVATAENLRGVKLVCDLVYNPHETRLIREAKAAGAESIGGFDMLIAQAAQQFKIWTGEWPPDDIMSAAAKTRLYEG